MHTIDKKTFEIVHFPSSVLLLSPYEKIEEIFGTYAKLPGQLLLEGLSSLNLNCCGVVVCGEVIQNNNYSNTTPPCRCVHTVGGVWNIMTALLSSAGFSTLAGRVISVAGWSGAGWYGAT